MSECQSLVKECQIYKAYTIFLGLAVGFFVFSFRFEKPFLILIWVGLLAAIAGIAAAMVVQYDAIYESYPGIENMKCSWLWIVSYVLFAGMILYISTHPNILLTAKCIIIGLFFTYCSQHPMRGINKYIRNIRR